MAYRGTTVFTGYTIERRTRLRLLPCFSRGNTSASVNRRLQNGSGNSAIAQNSAGGAVAGLRRLGCFVVNLARRLEFSPNRKTWKNALFRNSTEFSGGCMVPELLEYPWLPLLGIFYAGHLFQLRNDTNLIWDPINFSKHRPQLTNPNTSMKNEMLFVKKRAMCLFYITIVI